MGLNDFPPELVTRIFLQLSYKSLLAVLAVCTQWNAIVAKDPALSVQMFKRLSTVYVDPGSTEPWVRSSFCAASSPEPIRMHPALFEVSYSMGSDRPSFITGKAPTPDKDGFFIASDIMKSFRHVQLSELAIANDFISIPVVTMAKLLVPDRLSRPTGFKIKVINTKGIRLMDVFAAMEKESNTAYLDDRPPFHHPHFRTMTKAAVLGDHVHYEGFRNVARRGLGLSADLYLGS
ncbi:hypothetical protein DFH06DRAFT_703102 [Mycena polygramma]|nr:hypothetical protein DFH06DRAFT_703102 [Mycena polygramma]